ncbi:hypothetical protein CDD83_10915 [Cordyceps sp. RAO-2017]|nr:hypothetical protein CDD83_10915 [Cordyceps sp. RAO-2017]
MQVGKLHDRGLTASAPAGLDAARFMFRLLCGWISVNGSDGSSLSVPYQLFAGSTRDHGVLPRGGLELAYRNASVGEGATVWLSPRPGSSSRLVFNINATLGIPLLRAYAAPSSRSNDTADALGISIASKELGDPPRWLPNGLFSFTWDGRLESGD